MGRVTGFLGRREENLVRLADTLPELRGLGITPDPRRANPREVSLRFAVLLGLTFVQFNTVSRLGWDGIGLAVGILSALSGLAWATWVLGWALPWRHSPYLALLGLLMLGTAGAALTGLLTKDVGVSPVFPAVASIVISMRWTSGRAAIVVGWFELVLLVCAATQGWHQFATNGLGYGGLLAERTASVSAGAPTSCARTAPRNCSRRPSGPTTSRRTPRRWPSVAGSRARSTTCSRIRSPR